MKITKINHSTILLKHKNISILFDPGDYTIDQINSLQNIDLLIITHTHSDHLHLESVKILIKNNPGLHIIGNTEVQNLLNAENIAVEVCEKGQITNFNDIKIESFDFPHVEIWKDMKHPQNTGYLIDDLFYNPADSFGIIDREIPICIFMITGPAVKLSEALEFAISQKPKVAIGVHDGMLNRTTGSQKIPELILPENGIEYFNLEAGKEYEF